MSRDHDQPPYEGPKYLAPYGMRLHEGPFSPTAGEVQAILHLTGGEPVPDDLVGYLLGLDSALNNKDFERLLKTWNESNELVRLATYSLALTTMTQYLTIRPGEPPTHMALRQNNLALAAMQIGAERAQHDPTFHAIGGGSKHV